MTAGVLYGKEHVVVEEVPTPRPEAGEIVVRVRAALTCGTDLKVYRRGYHARMISPPALFGHELAGDVAAVGEGVTRFHLGQRVTAANSAPCGACFYCDHDQENLCEHLMFNNGAYAQYIQIPARLVEKNTYALPAHLSYMDAALTEPLACVVKGVADTGIRAGDTVAVIGLGPIGAMFVKLAKLQGARVIGIARRRTQVDRAIALGADDGIATEVTPDAVAEARYMTRNRGVDAAIEAVGRPETWSWAISMVRKGGTVNLFGGPPAGSEVQLDTNLVHYSELTCRASFHHTPAYIRKALGIIGEGHVAARDLVDREEPLANLPGVMRDLAARGGGLKTAIHP